MSRDRDRHSHHIRQSYAGATMLEASKHRKRDNRFKRFSTIAAAPKMLAECESLAPAKLLFAQALSLTRRSQLNNIQIA
jgi:hypothetical protein